jgi:hypothetical protein
MNNADSGRFPGFFVSPEARIGSHVQIGTGQPGVPLGGDWRR